MTNKRFTVELTEEQYKVIDKLAKHDNVTIKAEIQLLLNCQITEEKELMEREPELYD